MFGLWRQEAGGGAPSDRPRCARCGTDAGVHYVGPGYYYCEPCLRRAQRAPEVPFDVVVNEWTAELGLLQAAGELIAVRLPRGFYGVCLLTAESAGDLARRLSARRRSPVRMVPPVHHPIGLTLPRGR